MNLELPLAAICFLVPHVVPSVPGLRPWLIGKLGRVGYLSAYVALSAITFIWLIVAGLRAPYVGLWVLSAWQVFVTLILVALGCVLLVAGLATPNPLSLSLRPADVDEATGAILRATRHPLLWALGLWGLSHVLVNGDVASIMLFGMLAIFALGYMPLLDRRMQKARGMEDWQRLSAGSSNMLFAAYFRNHSRPLVDRTLLLSVIGGFALFFLLLYLHGPIIGVNPLGSIL
ncbi:MAG: NnrU family protein [Gammaproteobacteria bacterium]|nr:NnrU family protein [Gammaproteobacteria bacterium]